MAPCILFDLDGTLTDPQEGIVASLRHALGRLDVEAPPDAVLARHIGPPLADTFAALLPHPEARVVERATALYRERFADTGWRENRLLPGIPALLRAVAERGYEAAIATSKPTVFARRIADHFALRPPIGGVYGSGLDGRLGRKPELLAHVLGALGRAPGARDVVMVGDRRHDVEGARAVGVASLGVTWGFGDRAELAAAGATEVCDTPAEVLAALERLLARPARGPGSTGAHSEPDSAST